MDANLTSIWVKVSRHFVFQREIWGISTCLGIGLTPMFRTMKVYYGGADTVQCLPCMETFRTAMESWASHFLI
jgi:hypothetical protein